MDANTIRQQLLKDVAAKSYKLTTGDLDRVSKFIDSIITQKQGKKKKRSSRYEHTSYSIDPLGF